MIISHKYEHFVQFTIDILDKFVRKDIHGVSGVRKINAFLQPWYIPLSDLEILEILEILETCFEYANNG